MTSVKELSGQICQICGDEIEFTVDGEPFVACNECAFPVCRSCYEYERREGNQACPQYKTRYKHIKGEFLDFDFRKNNKTLYQFGCNFLFIVWLFVGSLRVESGLEYAIESESVKDGEDVVTESPVELSLASLPSSFFLQQW